MNSKGKAIIGLAFAMFVSSATGLWAQGAPTEASMTFYSRVARTNDAMNGFPVTCLSCPEWGNYYQYYKKQIFIRTWNYNYWGRCSPSYPVETRIGSYYLCITNMYVPSAHEFITLANGKYKYDHKLDGSYTEPPIDINYVYDQENGWHWDNFQTDNWLSLDASPYLYNCTNITDCITNYTICTVSTNQGNYGVISSKTERLFHSDLFTPESLKSEVEAGLANAWEEWLPFENKSPIQFWDFGAQNTTISGQKVEAKAIIKVDDDVKWEFTYYGFRSVPVVTNATVYVNGNPIITNVIEYVTTCIFTNSPWNFGPAEVALTIPGITTRILTNNGCPYYVCDKSWIEIPCGLSASSGCASGGCALKAGGTKATLAGGAMDVQMGLGTMPSGGTGRLNLRANRPSPTIYTGSLLMLAGTISETEVVRSNNLIQQVIAPNCIASVSRGNSQLNISYYTRDHLGEKDTNGMYSFTGAPFASTSIRQGASTNNIIVEATVGSETYTHNFDWTPAVNQWTHQDGTIKKESSSWNEISLVRSNKVMNAGNIVSYEESLYYQKLPGTNGKVLIQKIVGSSASAKTSQWFYETNQASADFGRVMMEVDDRGGWNRYTYDALGAVQKTVSCFGNSLTNATENQSRVVTRSTFTTNGANIDCEVETLLGIEVSRSYTVHQDDKTIQMRCRTAGAQWNAADNLATTNWTYSDGRPWKSVNPDGTMQFYLYQTNSTYSTNDILVSDYTSSTGTSVTNVSTVTNITCVTNCFYTTSNDIVIMTYSNVLTWTNVCVDTNVTWQSECFNNAAMSANVMSLRVNQSLDSVLNIVLSGVPNESKTSIVDGTRTATLVDYRGLTLEVEVADIATGLVLKHDFLTYDDLGRLKTTLHMDGTTEKIEYSDCCGIYSTTDREGNTTTYLYDDGKRQYGTLRNGIENSSDLDASGRVTRRWRKGTDQSVITLSRMAYNTAGDLQFETNGLNGVTSYTQTINGNGETVRTINYPDGGQQIETTYRDGSTKSVTGTAAQAVYYEYGVDGDGTYTKTYRGSAGGAEWEKSSSDMLGRGYKTLWPGNAVQITYYNNKGQMTNSVDPDGVSMFYVYNSLGSVEYTIADANRNGSIDWTGTDRISRTQNDVILVDDWSAVARRSRTWRRNDSNTDVLVQESWQSVDGSKTLSIASGLTNRSETTLYSGSQQRKTITTTPDGTTTESWFLKGQLASVTCKDLCGNQVSYVTYGYDSHGRQYQITDARNGTTTYGYHPQADLVQTVTTPAPADGVAPLVTTTYYDKSLRATNVVQPDSTSAFTEYYPNGSLKKTWGSRTYPVSYTYDYAGRMQTMTTWQNYAGSSGTAVTTWNYDASRGWLSGKVDANNKSVTYSNTSAGRLYSRKWARNLTTTYGYNNLGELQTVTYSDSTPGITYGYNRFGQQTSASQGATTVGRLYSDAGQLLRESYSGGPLGGISVSNTYDAFLRRTNFAMFNQATAFASTAYSYDDASRLKNVGSGTVSAEYSYLANSPLVEQIQFKNGEIVQMTTTKTYDLVNRLTSMISTPSASPQIRSDYSYNDASQRTGVTNVDGSYWIYQYDSLGQVTSGKKYWSDGTLVAGQQFDYAFDDIGNRKTASRSGGSGGMTARTSSYSVNSLNQYTSRTVPGWVSLSGEATNTATVTVNDQFTVRHDNAWWGEVLATNVAGPAWLGVTNRAVLRDGGNPDITNAVTGGTLVPKASESFTYDDDGNMTSDSLWTNTWNGENRLSKQESVTSVPPVARMREEWTHLPDGRWIERIVSTNNGTSWYPSFTNRYVWDGNVLVAVLNNANAPIQTYVRGLDLSGSIQGAGGVGGVLWISEFANAQIVDSHLTAFDGNGNMMALVKASDGAESARYEYGPFGETIRATGPMAKVNPIRFSTQYADDVTGNLKYLFRDYCPSTGRWPSRDPIKESGGVNLYLFIKNDSCDNIDIFGEFMIGKHYDITYYAAIQAGFRSKCAKKLAVASRGPDVSVHMFDGSYHYTRKIHGDKENAKKDAEKQKNDRFIKGYNHASKQQCSAALHDYGFGLHILQDYYSHVIDDVPVAYALLEIYPEDEYPTHKKNGRDHDPAAATAAQEATLEYLTGIVELLECCCLN